MSQMNAKSIHFSEELLEEQDKTSRSKSPSTLYDDDITTNDNSNNSDTIAMSSNININYRRPSISNSVRKEKNSKKYLRLSVVQNNEETDEKLQHLVQHPQHRKRAETMTNCSKNDVITRFIQKNRNFSQLNLSQTEKQFKTLSKDELLKRCRIVYDRANSLINKKSERDSAIFSFCECLNIIYLLYNSSILLTDMEKSGVIGQHMNVLLNLGSLFTEKKKLTQSIKMYNEAQVLYECDERGFRSNINLKSHILRGIADVYIEEKEFLAALGLLEEALHSTQATNDTVAQYQILCTKGRALFDAEQLFDSCAVFEEAMTLLTEISRKGAKAYDLYDVDLYRNAALCYKRLAHGFCSMVYINSTKTYAIKNSEKSMQYWNKSAACAHHTVKICKHLYGIQSAQYVQSLYEWSDVLCTKGEYQKSWSIYQNIHSLFEQLDEETKQENEAILNKTKEMIETLRPYMNENTL